MFGHRLWVIYSISSTSSLWWSFYDRVSFTNWEKSFPTNASISIWNSRKYFWLSRAGSVSDRYLQRRWDYILICVHSSKRRKSADEVLVAWIATSAGPSIESAISPNLLKVTLILFYYFGKPPKMTPQSKLPQQFRHTSGVGFRPGCADFNWK